MNNLQEKPDYVLNANFWTWWWQVDRLGSTNPVQGPETAKVCGREKQWVVCRCSDCGYQVVTRCATFADAQTVAAGLEHCGHRYSISNANDGVETYGPEILINRLHKKLLAAQHLAASLRDRRGFRTAYARRAATMAQRNAEEEAAAIEGRIEREILAVSLRAARRGYVATLKRVCNARLFALTPIGEAA